MWVFAILVVLTSVLTLALQSGSDDPSRLLAAEAEATAETMAVYRAAAIDYTQAHPGFDGALPEASLALPTWARRNASVGCVVSAGTVAVYLGGDGTAGVVDAMDRLSRHSIMVGTARRSTGTLVSPSVGDLGIVVPAQVPDGAPTWLGDAQGVAS